MLKYHQAAKISERNIPMGIRPRKVIGWSTTVKGNEINKKAVNNILEEKTLNYKKFLEYIKQHNLTPQKYSKNNERLISLDKKKQIFEFISIISKTYDSNIDFNDETWTIVFYPLVLSVIASEGSKEYKSDDTAFTYAEIEKFFPKSMETLETCSYNFKITPFPSEYSIIHKKDFSKIEDFQTLDNQSIYADIKKCLIDTDNEYLDVFAKISGFKNVEKVRETYTLAPPEEIFALAQYSNIFKNESEPFKLLPQTTYYWE